MKSASQEDLRETRVLYFSVLDIITLIFSSSSHRSFVIEGITETAYKEEALKFGDKNINTNLHSE
jgi:hypothetical protein